MKGLMQQGAAMVAASLEHARRSAVIDWGWAHVGPGKFRRPDGLEVTYAAGESALRGYPRGALLFLGQGWAGSPAIASANRQAVLARFTVAREPNQRATR